MSESQASPRIKLRIENLSDLVFGLALSIGSIVLISKLPQTPTDLLTGMVLFGFSFLIVIWIWVGYSTILAVLPYELRGALVLNIVLLYCVAMEPYLYYVLTQSLLSLLDFASAIYALDVAAMLFILAGLTRLLLIEENKSGVRTLPPDRLGRFRRLMIFQVVAGAIFTVSTLPWFWAPVPIGSFLRFDVWYVVLAFLLVAPRLGRSRRTSQS